MEVVMEVVMDKTLIVMTEEQAKNAGVSIGHEGTDYKVVMDSKKSTAQNVIMLQLSL